MVHPSSTEKEDERNVRIREGCRGGEKGEGKWRRKEEGLEGEKRREEGSAGEGWGGERKAGGRRGGEERGEEERKGYQSRCKEINCQ